MQRGSSVGRDGVGADCTHQECGLSPWKCYYFTAIPAAVTVDSVKGGVA